MIIIADVFKIKRGIVIEINNPDPVPQVGEIYSCGVDSWIIKSVEKIKNGCFSIADKDSYLFLIESLDNSDDPIKGFILDKSNGRY